jgi:hypothetical protein
VGITGKSGSGKSTLLNLIAAIDRPTTGDVTVAGTALRDASEQVLARWRGATVGIVFQFFQLLPTLTVVENVTLPMDFLRARPVKTRRPHAMELLARVGLADQADKLPATLSADNSSAWRLRARSRTIRRSSPPMSRPAISTRRRQAHCSICSGRSPPVEPPSSSSRTSATSRESRTAHSRWRTGECSRPPRTPLGAGSVVKTVFARWATAGQARWSKVVADVWRDRSRTALVVLAIGIGLSGFLAVLSTYAILGREINRGYLDTNPASAILRTDAIDDALLASVIARDDVDDADARRVVNARVRIADGTSRHIVLFVIRDFNQLRISTVTSEGGEWPPSPGAVLIERDAFQVAKARIDDRITILLPQGREQELRVAGGVHDAGQAQARMENSVYAYITPQTLALLDEAATLDRLYVIAGGDRFDAAHVRRVADDVKAALEASGHAVRRVDVPPPGQHPHSVIMGFLLLVMAAFGFLALMLSGTIVVNLVFATMANERRQIGVMKAIGGTRGQIAAIYLAEAALLGVAAIATATPAGMAGGRALSRYFGVLLNFDLASLAGAGVGLPPRCARRADRAGCCRRVSSGGGTGMTVRDAIAAAGIDAANFGSRRLDRLLCGIVSPKLIGGPLLLGVRNSARRRTRTALTLLTLTLAGAFFIRR